MTGSNITYTKPEIVYPFGGEKKPEVGTVGAPNVTVTYGNPLELSLREEGLIKNCIQYADNNPSGLPGHQLMLLVAKLAKRCGLA